MNFIPQKFLNYMHWDLQLKKQKQNLMTNKLNSMVPTQTLCHLKTSELISESVPLPSHHVGGEKVLAFLVQAQIR